MISHTEHYINSVKLFMKTFDQKAYRFASDVPAKTIKLRAALIEEETKEYLESKTDLDKLDAICDLLYIVAGTMITCGIKPEAYSNVKPRLPFDISTGCLLVAAACKEALPCHRKLYRYSNVAMKLLEDCGSSYALLGAFNCVHENNMEKLWNFKSTDSTLTVIRKGDKYLVLNTFGKVIKPPKHQPPNLAPFIDS